MAAGKPSKGVVEFKAHLERVRQLADILIENYAEMYPEAWLAESSYLTHTQTRKTGSDEKGPTAARTHWKNDSKMGFNIRLYGVETALESGGVKSAQEELRREYMSAALKQRQLPTETQFILDVMLLAAAQKHPLKGTLDRPEDPRDMWLKQTLIQTAGILPDDFGMRDAFVKEQVQNGHGNTSLALMELATQGVGTARLFKKMKEEAQEEAVSELKQSVEPDGSNFLSNFFAVAAIKMQQILAKEPQKGHGSPRK